MAIIQNRNGRYRVLARPKGQRSISKTFNTHAAAQAFRRRIEDAIASGTLHQQQAEATTLEALIDSDPQFSDSYDVLGKVHMEQGNLTEALATYRTAAEMTPGCVLRLQHAGTLSYYAGDARGAGVLERGP